MFFYRSHHNYFCFRSQLNSKSSSSSTSQSHSKHDSSRSDHSSKPSTPVTSRPPSVSSTHTHSQSSLKYSSGLTIQPAMKLPEKHRSKNNDLNYLSKPKVTMTSNSSTSSSKSESGCPSPSIFSNPLSLASNNGEKLSGGASLSATSQNSGVAGLPASILR